MRQKTDDVRQFYSLSSPSQYGVYRGITATVAPHGDVGVLLCLCQVKPDVTRYSYRYFFCGGKQKVISR